MNTYELVGLLRHLRPVQLHNQGDVWDPIFTSYVLLKGAFPNPFFGCPRQSAWTTISLVMNDPVALITMASKVFQGYFLPPSITSQSQDKWKINARTTKYLGEVFFDWIIILLKFSIRTQKMACWQPYPVNFSRLHYCFCTYNTSIKLREVKVRKELKQTCLPQGLVAWVLVRLRWQDTTKWLDTYPSSCLLLHFGSQNNRYTKVSHRWEFATAVGRSDRQEITSRCLGSSKSSLGDVPRHLSPTVGNLLDIRVSNTNNARRFTKSNRTK